MQRLSIELDEAESGVVEYRPYADGTSQVEARYHVRKDGPAKEQGLFSYIRFHGAASGPEVENGTTKAHEGPREETPSGLKV